MNVTITLALSTETLLLGHELVAVLGRVAEAMAKVVPAVDVARSASSPPPPTPVYVPAKWTDERKALLRERFPTGESFPDILAALNALPGEPIDRRQAQAYAQYMKLSRPFLAPAPVVVEPPAMPAAAAASPEPAAPTPTPPASRMDTLRQVAASLSREPVTADFWTVAQWAGERGIACRARDDLPAVNAKRHSLGLAAFVLPDIR